MPPVGSPPVSVPSNRLAVALHGELLQVGRESERGHGLYGSTAVVGMSEEVPVPHGDQAHQRRDVALESEHLRKCSSIAGIRRASHGSSPGRSRSWWTSRWRGPSNIDRPPNPRTRTCSPPRCRMPEPRPHSSKRPRNAEARSLHRGAPASHVAVNAHCHRLCVVNVLEATINKVVAGSRSTKDTRDVGWIDIGNEVAPKPGCRSAAKPGKPWPVRDRTHRFRYSRYR